VNAIFDCNVFDQLQASESALLVVRERISKGKLRVVMPRTLWQEVSVSPHAKLALALPVHHVGDSVMFANGSVGDRVGSARLYTLHRGESSKHEDALIADAADYDADFLVSQDSRLRKRLNEHAVRCQALSFEEFIHIL
jgi:predicted nucleic acid-binding protein